MNGDEKQIDKLISDLFDIDNRPQTKDNIH